MSKKILTLALAAILMIGVSVPTVSHAWYNMYVYTENGKSLNVRSEPRTGNNVLWTVPYGEQVTVDYNLGNGWTALMAAGAYETVYVQTRFLVYEKPKAKPAQNNTGSSSSTSGSTNPATNAATAKELNKIFRTYKRVNPYKITVRPVRASGWVNLRFAPSKETEVMATYKANDQVTVIAELDGWYQVEDPNTGMVGYMSNQFVAK
ncbi:MAG: SH3 domain-containing protein [Clostridia bacterium]|nr:SH3 domain-containing protein [Clostridia bacterium]